MPTRTRRSPAAKIRVLFEGYSEPGVAGTVALIEDGAQRIVVDPGMVPRRESILRPLRAARVAPDRITDVIFSHHHPDHTLNAALFPRARFHDHWAIYHGDVWESRPAEAFQLSPHVRLTETPGHTPQDITTLVDTPEGTYAFTHLWWDRTGPPDDPLAIDGRSLHAHRARIVKIARWIVPGHGAPFSVSPETPL